MSANAAAFARLNEQIRRIRSIPKLARAAAPEVAQEVKREIDATIAAGTDPEGNPWPATKSGDPALVNAARAVSVRAVGSVVLVTLTGPEVHHHRGGTRGHVRRPIIPTRGLPGPMTKAIRTVLARRFGELMKGGNLG